MEIMGCHENQVNTMHRTIPLTLLLPIASAFCPLYGPTFSPPKNPGSSKSVQAALEKLTGTIDAARKDPNNTAVSNATTVSVHLYSTHSERSLLEYHREGTNLNTTIGVKKVDSNSIWRIASISKLIAVYLTLREVGDRYWDVPVSDVLPELKDGKWKENPIDYVNWEEVTLGTLAGQTSGVVNSRKWYHYRQEDLDQRPNQ